MAGLEKDLFNRWLGKTSPLVSIVCAAYNHELFIKEAIEGFLGQATNFPFEIIIGEDCSKDKTREIVERYREAYPNIIRIVSSEKNVGMHKNFERSIEAAKGKFIALCEGDDYWICKDKLQMQIDFLSSHPEYAFSAHRVKVIDQTVYGRAYSPYKIFEKSEIETSDILLDHFIPTLSLVFRKDALYFPPWAYFFRSLDIVMELIVSLSGKGKFFFDEMGVYRHHDGGITKSDNSHYEELYKKEMELFQAFDEHTKGKFSLIVKKRLAKIAFSFALASLKRGELKNFGTNFFNSFCLAPHFVLSDLCYFLGQRKLLALWTRIWG